jgi:hypothetical protein
MSDERIKNNVSNDTTGLNLIRLLRPVTYNVDYEKVAEIYVENIGDDSPDFMKESRKNKSEKTEYGFIAQEVQNTIEDLRLDLNNSFIILHLVLLITNDN